MSARFECSPYTLVLHRALEYSKKKISEPSQSQSKQGNETRWVLLHERNMLWHLYCQQSWCLSQSSQSFKTTGQNISRLFSLPVEWHNKQSCFSFMIWFYENKSHQTLLQTERQTERQPWLCHSAVYCRQMQQKDLGSLAAAAHGTAWDTQGWIHAWSHSEAPPQSVCLAGDLVVLQVS